MSMFKNTSGRRILSWILTLTMLFSQFVGTDAAITAFAAPSTEGLDFEFALDGVVQTSAEYSNGSNFHTVAITSVSFNGATLDSVSYDKVVSLNGAVVDWDKVKNAGTYSVTITGKGEGGQAEVLPVTKTFTINPKALTDEMVTLSLASAVYDGDNKNDDITITVKDGDVILARDTDYTVSVNNAALADASIIAVDTYTVKVNGIGNYDGTIEKVFTVTPQSIAGATVTLHDNSVVYNGEDQKDAIVVDSVVLGVETLNRTTDYTVSVNEVDIADADNKVINAGSYRVTVSGQGNYDGVTAAVAFTVEPKSITGASVSIDGATTFGYNSTEQTVAPEKVVVKVGGKTLEYNTDYTVSGNTGTVPGDYEITVTGKGNYTGVADDKEGWKIIKTDMSVSAPNVNVTYDTKDHGISVNNVPDGATVSFSNDGGITYSLEESPVIKDVKDSPKTVYYKVVHRYYVDFYGTATISINKAKWEKPEVPEEASKTTTSITLKTITDGEYSMNDGEWQDSAVFTGLSENTAYSFRQRVKGNDNYEPSESSNAVEITTTAHAHSWDYRADGNVITAECLDTDGGHGSAEKVFSLSFNASENSIKYVKDAKRTVSWNAETAARISVSVTSITYEKKNGSTWEACGDPEDAGDYRATVKVRPIGKGAASDLTVTVEYTIEKADIELAAGNKPVSNNSLHAFNNQSQTIVDFSKVTKPEGATELRYAVIANNKKLKPTEYVSGNKIDETAAATYYVWYYWVGSSNYNDTEPALVVEDGITIVPAEVTIKANDSTKVYGAEEPSLTATVTGELPGVPLDYDVTREEGENVGVYRIDPVVGDNSSYHVTTVSGAFTITQKPVSVNGIIAKDKEYDGTDVATFDCSEVNFYDIYGLDVDDAGLSVSANGKFSNENVSENKAVTITGITLSGNNSKNYTLSDNICQKTATASITKRTIIVSASDQTLQAGDNIDPKGYSVKNLADGHKVIVTLDVSGNTTSADTAGRIIPVVSDVQKISDSSSVSDNYIIVSENGILTVTKVKATVTTPPVGNTLTYNGKDQSLIVPGIADGNGTMGYYLSADGELPEDAEFTADIPKAKDADTYTVYYRALPKKVSQNIAGDPKKVTATIKQKTLIVTASDNTITYGETPKANGVSYNGIQGSDNGDEILSGGITYSFDYDQYDPVGDNYKITPVISVSSDNYKITPKSGTLTVEQKEIGLDWSDLELTYNGSVQLPTVSANGTVSNDVVKVTVGLVSGNGTTVGKHIASANAVDNTNYKLPENRTQEYEIVSATASLNAIPVASSNMVYNGTEQILLSGNAATSNGYIKYALEEDETSVPAEQDWTDAVPTAKNAGTYYVWYKIEGLDNYSDLPAASISASIAQKQASVSVNDGQKKTYGDDDPEFTVSVNGVVGTEKLNYTLERESGENKGTYKISVVLGDNPNYKISTKTAMFAIEKRIVSVNGITTDDKVYDGTNVAELNFDKVVFKNKLDKDNLTVTATGTFGGTTVSDNYTVTISDLELGGTSAGNYSLDADSQSVITGKAITKRPITIAAKDQTVSKNAVLVVSVDNVEITNTDPDEGLASGEVLAEIAMDEANTTGTDVATQSGTIVLNLASVRINDAKKNNVTSNYQITLDSGVLIVQNPYAEYTLEPKEKTVSYNGYPQDLVTAGTSAQGTVMYSTELDGEYTDTIPARKDAGSYTVYYYIQGNTGYRTTEKKAISHNTVINKADLIVSANDVTITYGQAPANDGIKSIKFLGNDKKLDGTLTFTYDYQQYGNVGTYKIIPGGYTSANYNIINVPGTLTVEQKVVGITWGSRTLTYTGKLQAPEATATGIVNNDTVSVNVTGQKTEVGTNYLATAASLTNDNYKLPAELSQVRFEIVKAENPLVTKPTAKEGLVYNGDVQTLVEPGEVTASKLLYYTTDRSNDVPTDDDFKEAVPAKKDAGEYYVWYKVPGIENSSASVNATLVSSNAIKIERADLTIFAEDKSITYGDDPAVYTVSSNGLQGNDTIDLSAYTASCDYVKKGNAGSYTISLNTTAAINNPNYDIKTENGTLTVNPIVAELKWTPDPAVFTYKRNTAQAPAATVTNALAGDEVEVTVTGAQTDVGDYTATATDITTGGVTNINYALSANSTKDFSITIAASVITKEPVAKTSISYNGYYQTLVVAGTATGGDLEYAFGDLKNQNTVPTSGWSTDIPEGKDAGEYLVWRRVNGNGNYEDIEAEVVALITISPAPLTVTSADLYVEYGTPRADLDVKFALKSIVGFVGTDNTSSLSGTLSYICDYQPYGNEEYYTITPKGYKSDNYDITFVGSRCFPTARVITLNWDETEFVYDGQAHVPTVSAGNVLDQDMNKIKVVVKVVKDNSDDVIDSVSAAGSYLAKATEVLYVTGQTTETAIHYTLPKDVTVPFTIAKANISENKITEPEAKTGLVYSASSQQLVTAGTVSDNLGTFRYALAASENTAEADLTFGNDIPTGKDAGTYYVWYMVSSNNANYNDTAAKKVSVSIDAATVTVSYNANEGEGTMASEEFEISCSADMVTVSTNSFTKEGYEFVSWNTAADGSGTGYAEGDTFAPETIEDITLYAQWKPITFSVSFNMNGHGEQIDAVEVISGNTVEAPADPTADGYAFGGWFTEAECSTSYNFATPVTEDIELFAKWTEKFTVSFNMGGHGTQIAAKEVVSGDTVSKPADPTADGFAFGGWFTESELTNEYDFATPVSANITLFAKWTEKFTVSFNMSGHGKQIDSQEVVSGDKAVRPADPTDPEYTFEDWFTAADYASVYDFNTAVSENITVYAKWNLTISLNSISINKAPDKTVYTEGEVFDTTGMEVVATYTDGNKKTVSGYTITPSANLTASDNKVTVSYTEDGITCTADVAIKVVAKDAADVVVEDEEYSAWNLYEDNTEHTFTVAGASGNAVKNSNSKSAVYYDAELNGDTITVTAKGDLKKAAKAANAVLEFVTDDGVVEFTLPVEYKKPQLKLSVAKVNVKNGAETVVKTTISRKSAAGVFEPMDLTNATVTFEGKDIEILENGEIAITVNGGVKGKINVVGEGWNSADPVALNFNVKGSDKDVISVEMGGVKTVIVNSNAKDQSFEFPVFFSGVEADSETVTIEDKKNSGLAKIEGGNLVIAYPEAGVKKGNYTITLKGGSAKAVKVKVKVSDKALTEAVKLTVKSKYDVVTGQKMVIVPNFKDLGGKLEDVSIDMEGFSAVVNEAGNIVVDYEGSAYTVQNLNIGTMTFKLSVEGVEDEIAVAVNNVKAKKSAVKVKAAAVTMKAGAEGVANLVCSYTDSAKNLHLVAPLSVKIAKVKNVTATVSEEDPTVINLSGFSGKKGSVKVTATFPGGLEKTVTIKVKASK